MKKWIALLLALALLSGLTGCAKEPADTTDNTGAGKELPVPEEALGKVGVCLPGGNAYWTGAAEQLALQLAEMQYAADVQYAKNSVTKQAEQMEKMIDAGVDCLVIAAVDSVALVEAEKRAKEAGIPIIAFDRMLMDTDAVTAAVTFDYIGIGAAIAQHIVEQKQLATAQEEDRSYTIEFIMGPADDNSAVLLHSGVMSVLQTYLDTGVLQCKTGRVSFEDAYVSRWDKTTARDKCAYYLANSYKSTNLDIVCAASDALAAGCIEALEVWGVGQEDWPMITGQEGSLTGVQNVVAGKQAVTVYKDTAMLAEKCAQMAVALIRGEAPEINDTASGNNHVTTVPSYICDTKLVDRENYKEVVVKTGIYQEKQLKTK